MDTITSGRIGPTLHAPAQPDPPADLSGRTVILVHPPWHSCGSYEVFASQARAYRSLGSRVVSVAVGVNLRQHSNARGFWRHYYKMTGGFPANERFHTGPSVFLLKRAAALRDFYNRGRFDHAAAASLPAVLAPIPSGLLRGGGDVHHIHCNHFFNMPIARKIKARLSCPIVLDTHDIQAHQFSLRGERDLFSRRISGISAMLESEVLEMQDADSLIHLNADEASFFSALLPQKPHTLVYPHIRAPGPKVLADPFVLLVAASNYPNYLSVKWFISSILPALRDIPICIVGDVVHEFRKHDPEILARHEELFVGRVDDVAPYYQEAAVVAIPTKAGHGLSIKTVEAMAAGLPMVATSMAFRGIDIESRGLTNLIVADEASEFTAAVLSTYRRQIERRKGIAMPEGIDTRAVYDARFSFEAYVRGLRKAISAVRDAETTDHDPGGQVRPQLEQSQPDWDKRAAGEVFESILETIYTNYLRPGDAALDGGAHVGRHTFPMARVVGPTGRVLAVEPLPGAREYLSQRLTSDRLHQVHLFPIALGAEPGEANLFQVRNRLGYSGLQLSNARPQETAQPIRVLVETIDGLVPETLALRFIKLDLEGGEYHALVGARDTITRKRPMIVLEHGGEPSARTYRYSRDEWFKLFDDQGYVLRDILGRPFSKGEWERPGTPWYLIATASESDSEHFCVTHLPRLVSAELAKHGWMLDDMPGFSRLG